MLRKQKITQQPVTAYEEKHEPHHIENRRQTLQYLTDEPSNTPACPRIDKEDRPERPGHPEMRGLPDQNGDRLDEHDGERDAFQHGTLVPENGRPADPAELECELDSDYRQGDEFERTVNTDGEFEERNGRGLDQRQQQEEDRRR